MYQAQDAAEQLRDRLYRLSYSADELEQLEERLDLLHLTQFPAQLHFVPLPDADEPQGNSGR